MKKILSVAAAIIITAGTAAFASGAEKEKPVSQKTSYQLSFAKLQVENDIDIMLVEDDEKSLEFSGTDASIAKVNWKIKNGILYISSKSGSLKGKVKITVNVNQLKEIAVKGESDVRSAGELNSTSLKIYVDGTSFISVRNRGQIKIEKEDGTELEIRKAIGNVTFE